MSVTIEEVESVWQEADCLWNQQQVIRAIDALADNVTRELSGSNPVVLVVMTGGLVFASELMMRMQFPLTLDYVHVSRYGDGLTGKQIHWKKAVPDHLEGRTVLIVDDILDEGQTLAVLIDACKDAGAATIKTAVLVDKQHDRKFDPALKADFTALTIPDRYIFGYGMDYKGYLRNAQGIYAVKGA